jgi:hypothetical protein
MESDVDFTLNINLPYGYVHVVRKARQALSKCLDISLEEINSNTVPNDLRYSKWKTFDEESFIDEFISLIQSSDIPTNTMISTNYYDRITSFAFFDEYFFFIRIKKGSPTVGDWIRNILLNCFCVPI